MQPSTLRIPGIEYHRPRTLEEARALISLRDVEGLDGIRAEGGMLHIGAMATIADVAGSELLRASIPALTEAARFIGCPQIRERATIGGNFCGAVPCADTPPACIVRKGTVHLRSRVGERDLAAENFFVGPRETVIRPGEILAEIRLPESPGAGCAYERFGLRGGMAVAVASVAAGLWVEDGRIA